MEDPKPKEINLEEIDESTGFKRAELYVWNSFESTYLKAAEDDREADVDSWVDSFIGQAEQQNIALDKIFVKSVVVLGIYAGPRDEFQQRCGNGKALYPNLDSYEGEFFEDRKHGTGHYIFFSQGRSEVDKLIEEEVAKVYGGEVTDTTIVDRIAEKFQVGRQIISSILEYGFFPCYHGDYVRGKRTGQGIMKNKDATIYKGEFLENKREGQGVFYYLNGDIFSGNWKDGFKHGYGTYHFASGDEYRGEWNKGKFVQGQWIRCDGTYYEGKFKRKNRPFDDRASIHFPTTKMVQYGKHKRGIWAPTSELMVSEEIPVDGMSWMD